MKYLWLVLLSWGVAVFACVALGILLVDGRCSVGTGILLGFYAIAWAGIGWFWVKWDYQVVYKQVKKEE